jgi:hypothetical protein
MACVSLDLLNLVLQRLEQYPIGVLYGVDVEGFGGEALDPLLERQILVQQRMLDELDGCPVQWIGTRPFLFDPDGERPPEAIDPRLLIAYEIDVLALCRALRRANQLAGPPVEELSDLAYFIGHRGSGRRRRSLCLVRLLRDDNVLDTIYLLRGHIAIGQLVVLTPKIVELRRPTMRSVAAEKTVIVSIPETLITTSAEPFALNIPAEMETEADAVACARLRLDTGSRIATLDGGEVDLTPREFDVLPRARQRGKRERRLRPSRGTSYYHRGASPE